VVRRALRNKSAVECERKFLVTTLPRDRSRYPHSLIQQGYLAITAPGSPGNEVRMRRIGTRTVLTVKQGHGVSRWETEIVLSPACARLLWPMTRGLRITKVRYEIPYRGLTIELDVYRGAGRGLVVAEVEFPSERASRSFVPPSWFGREVTGRKEYSNSQLAITQRLPRRLLGPPRLRQSKTS
jgi:adenylate cyclase